jgi:16S rRNA (uracil1498-N3)-methyltransferase
MPRFFCPLPLATAMLLELPAGAARHVQVLRMQPGQAITLFNGGWGPESVAGEFAATITQMGRSNVQVQVGAHQPVQRQAARSVHLAVGMPANERMDWLVEKAAEMGVASIQPLMTERSVLRLVAERASKKVAHWNSIAIAACEQCGGNQVPAVLPVQTLPAWLQTVAPNRAADRWLLSLQHGALPLGRQLSQNTSAPVTFLCGPEGGLGPAEEAMALAAGFAPVTLGTRVLRSETAALAALARILV